MKHVFVLARADGYALVPANQAEKLFGQLEGTGDSILIEESELKAACRKISIPIINVHPLHAAWTQVIQPRFASWDRNAEGEVANG